MIQTIRDVFERKAEVLAEFDRMSDPTSKTGHYFDSSELEEVVVLSDAIALRLLECTYLLNTEFIPSRLPGTGMCIGDFAEHKGETYLTFHLGVALANLKMLRAVRTLEPILRSWAEQKPALSAKVSAFLAGLRERDPECLKVKPFQSDDEWDRTYAGFAYVGTPSPEFVEALEYLALTLQERGRPDLSDFVAVAIPLANELRPYVDLPEQIQELRQGLSHKGVPSVHEGMLRLNSPAAIGGASLHTLPAGDDLLDGLPGSQTLFLIACQASRTGIPHFGGGKLQGVHYVFLPPLTPFFAMVQEQIERDPAFAARWEEMVKDDHDGEQWQEWHKLTEPVKSKVIREVVPQLIQDRALGFQVDLVSKKGAGILRPIVAEAHIRAFATLGDMFRITPTTPILKGFLLETSDSYGFPTSVFDLEPATEEPGVSQEPKMTLPKVLIVEDTADCQNHYRDKLGSRTELLIAASLEEGERLFQENSDIALVVMDACVPGESPNSMPLVCKIRKTFAGPIIATSGSKTYREKLVEAGCDHESDKFEVPILVKRLLQV